MNTLSRRSALKKIAGSAAAVTAVASLSQRLQAAEEKMDTRMKGQINHSVCKWCYGKIPLEDFCKAAKPMGLQSVELLGPSEWPMLKKYDLTCAMASGADNITFGFNRLENHGKQVEVFTKMIPQVADAGLTNLICFSGNRNGMSDEQGLENCTVGLKKLMSLAEKHKVTLVMELLNSKIDHGDYMADHTHWGVELVKRVGSERFKLLYDIYHMQIMEGDVIRTIKGDKGKKIESAAPYIAHYHTGGVPGRAEIDDSQELNYPAIMKAIIETGFKGFVAQEFIPKRADALASLKQGVNICDV
ncbi:MAG: hydroxypyruvate isomerase [Verrucomicrobiales bacterium]|nr:hydroxypyruvate isomerase [Verrucomicrobiales bacterium]